MIYNKILLYLLSFFAAKEGFHKDTLVAVKDNRVPISQLKEGDYVLSYDFDQKKIIESKVTKVRKNSHLQHYRLIIDGTRIACTPKQMFFCPLNLQDCWLQADEVKSNELLIKQIDQTARIENVELVNQTEDFYGITVEGTQNYFVTDKNFLVHNEPFTIGTTFIIGTIGNFVCSFTAEAAIPALIGLTAWGIKKLSNSDYPTNKQIAAATTTGILYKKMTNKEARRRAKELGMEEDRSKKRSNGPGDPNENDLIFEKNGKLYSPDRDQHNGSIWKMLDRHRRRIASCDAKLNIIKR